jgi:hypothetical protein
MELSSCGAQADRPAWQAAANGDPCLSEDHSRVGKLLGIGFDFDEASFRQPGAVMKSILSIGATARGPFADAQLRVARRYGNAPIVAVGADFAVRDHWFPLATSSRGICCLPRTEVYNFTRRATEGPTRR